MRIKKRLTAWLGHPINLALGIVMLASDIATIVGWVQDDDSTIMSVNPGPPLYVFVLVNLHILRSHLLVGLDRYAPPPSQPPLQSPLR